MTGTKERILVTALHQFAKNGYEAVSVSSIAGKLGITKGALYKHYKNKRDIFDSIVQRMYEIDAARAKEYGVPEGNLPENEEEYCQTSLRELAEYTKAQFQFWTEDEFASDFRRMLALEQYRDTEMEKLYRDCIIVGPVKYTEDLFAEMIKNKKIIARNPEMLALEFYAPMILLIQMSDYSEDKIHLNKLLNEHIKKIIKELEEKE